MKKLIMFLCVITAVATQVNGIVPFKQKGQISYQSLIEQANKGDKVALQALSDAWTKNSCPNCPEATNFKFIGKYLTKNGYSQAQIAANLAASVPVVPGNVPVAPPMGIPTAPPMTPSGNVPAAPPMGPVPVAPPMGTVPVAPPMAPPMSGPAVPTAPTPGSNVTTAAGQSAAEKEAQAVAKFQKQALALSKQVANFIKANSAALGAKRVNNQAKFNPIIEDFNELQQKASELAKLNLDSDTLEEKVDALEKIFKVLEGAFNDNQSDVGTYIFLKRKGIFTDYDKIGVNAKPAKKDDEVESAGTKHLLSLWNGLKTPENPISWNLQLDPRSGVMVDAIIRDEFTKTKPVKLADGTYTTTVVSFDETSYNKFINDVKTVADQIQQLLQKEKDAATPRAELNKEINDLTKIVRKLIRVVNPSEAAAKFNYKKVQNIFDPEFDKLMAQ